MQRGYGDTFYIDQVFVKINGKQHYPWRAIDQDGEVVDVCLQAERGPSTALIGNSGDSLPNCPIFPIGIIALS